jgi:hypothetical protein
LVERRVLVDGLTDPCLVRATGRALDLLDEHPGRRPWRLQGKAVGNNPCRPAGEGGLLMMRVVQAVAIALFVLLLAPGLAVASHGSGSGGPRDFAVGGGTTGNPSEPTGVQHVDFGASGGPTTFDPFAGIGGDPVTGHFRAGGAFDQAGLTEFQQEGPVTCLVVEGNRARLVYPNKHATPESNEALEVLIFLEDNGRPQNGQPSDRIGFILLPDETPEDDPPSEQDSGCVAPLVTPAMFTLQKGNFTIHDGS